MIPSTMAQKKDAMTPMLTKIMAAISLERRDVEKKDGHVSYNFMKSDMTTKQYDCSCLAKKVYYAHIYMII